jgi:hypothetical protein
MKKFALTFMFFILTVASTANAQDKLQNVDVAMLRLKPNAFSQLPNKIVSFLEKRNCTVPQAFNDSTPHNVIRGQFATKGQFDWAVLCSRDRVSSIMVFWNGSTKSVAEIASENDKDHLQKIDDTETIGFSRTIRVVGKERIFDYYGEHGGKKPPTVKNQGIADGSNSGDGSSLRYFYRKRWLRVQGF